MRRLTVLAVHLLCLLPLLFGVAHAQSCATSAGRWFDPTLQIPRDAAPLFTAMARRAVVLLGEQHDQASHHRWQLHTLAGLYAHQPNLVIGLEMLPRSVQPVLDRFSRGELDEVAFLAESRWQEHWGFDTELYLPILRFAQMHRLPLVALNVDRGLISEVARVGWAKVPMERREGLGDLLPATPAYRAELAQVFGHKNPDHQQDEAAFDRFVEAQLTWDRAFAEGLIQARRAHNNALAVGLVGRFHAQFGHGVGQQLLDLGVLDGATLLPVPVSDCEQVVPGLADAVFLLDDHQVLAEADGEPLRLGVQVADGADGVLVQTVVSDSVAAAAGLQTDDVIAQAAGLDIRQATELQALVRRQAPGTWLPLTVKRRGQVLDLVAKFAAKPLP